MCLSGVLALCPALGLSRNQIGDGGLDSLAGVLGQCTDLSHLDLSHNFRGESSTAESLTGVLDHCSTLVYLNLSGNKVKAVGAQTFAGVLA